MAKKIPKKQLVQPFQLISNKALLADVREN